MSIIIEITDPIVEDGLIAEANRRGTTPEAMLLAQLEREGRRLASRYKLDGIPSSKFILRFTPTEYEAIKNKANSSEEGASEVFDLLTLIGSEAYVNFADPRLPGGMALMISSGLLTPERAAEIVQRDRPERIEPPAA